MEEQLISRKIAELAEDKGCELKIFGGGFEYTDKDGNEYWTSAEGGVSGVENTKPVINCTQSLLQKWLREERGVHIEIHRNASGYYWSMCKADGGTDLGWSDHSGPNLGGVWDKFEEALEDAMFVQLSYDLPKDTKTIKHWGNYVNEALNQVK